MTDPADIALIAAKLTKAQRKAVLSFVTDYHCRHVPQPIAEEMLALGVITGPGRYTGPKPDPSPPQYMITPTGLAVRAELEKQHDQ